jgi:transposase
MDVCILDQAGETRLHRNMKTTPEALLKAIAPYCDQLVIAAAWMFTWYWLADFCAEHRMLLVLGHALSMKAIHGGKAKHDKLDAHQIAVLLRGGMLPQASVYPAAMRATRDRLRRRMHLRRKRSELASHGQTTTSQYHLLEIGQNIAYQANRTCVAERCGAPAGQKSIAIALALMGYYAALLRDLERAIVKAARHHDANPRYLLRPVPGIGKILSLVLLYAMHAIERVPRGQDLASYGRLVTCATAAAGQRSGTSGTQIGHAQLTWAFSAAAVVCLRDHPAGQTLLPRLEQKHSTGQALPILAHNVARAVYSMLKRKTAFEMPKCLHAYGRGVGELNASLDSRGMSLLINARQGVNQCVVKRPGAYRSLSLSHRVD